MTTDVGAILVRVGRGSMLLRLWTFVQRRPVFSVLILAFALRLAVAVAIAIVNPHNISPDGILYSSMAADKASGHTSGWNPYLHYVYHSAGALLVPLTFLYEVFGPHRIVGQLYVAMIGAAAAGLTVRLALEFMPLRWAVAAGAIIALLPSQIVWSSLVLKDSSVWLVLIGLALTVAIAGRSTGVRLVSMGLVAAGLLMLLGYLRLQTLLIACWALMLASIFGQREQRLHRVSGALALGVLIPWFAFDRGPAGISYIKSAPPPTQIRRGMVEYAHTVIPGAAPSPVTTPAASNPGPSAPPSTAHAVSSPPSQGTRAGRPSKSVGTLTHASGPLALSRIALAPSTGALSVTLAGAGGVSKYARVHFPGNYRGGSYTYHSSLASNGEIQVIGINLDARGRVTFSETIPVTHNGFSLGSDDAGYSPPTSPGMSRVADIGLYRASGVYYFIDGNPVPVQGSAWVDRRSGTPPSSNPGAASGGQQLVTPGVQQGGEISTDVKHLPQGLLAMLVEPYPWQGGGSVYLNLARLEAIVWYPLLLLAMVGLLALRPRHLRVIGFPLLAGGAILITYALIEGNLGTAFRHRGEFEWVIAILAVLGLVRSAAWRSGRRSAGPSTV